jgi:uncharacterized protein YqgV (UPF0045/DUF77 family)
MHNQVDEVLKELKTRKLKLETERCFTALEIVPTLPHTY